MLERPENSEESMKYILENKDWFIETDLQKTLDNKYVTLHDDNLY